MALTTILNSFNFTLEKNWRASLHSPGISQKSVTGGKAGCIMHWSSYPCLNSLWLVTYPDENGPDVSPPPYSKPSHGKTHLWQLTWRGTDLDAALGSQGSTLRKSPHRALVFLGSILVWGLGYNNVQRVPSGPFSFILFSSFIWRIFEAVPLNNQSLPPAP